MTGTEALRLLRDARGARTQAELAAEVGVSEATISRWLGAHSPPRKGLSRLVAWAEGRVRGRQAIGEGAGPSNYRLGVIAGQAAAVRRFLASAIEEQDRVLRGLAGLGAGQEPLGIDLSGLDETEAEEDAVDEARAVTRRVPTSAPQRRSVGE